MGGLGASILPLQFVHQPERLQNVPHRLRLAGGAKGGDSLFQTRVERRHPGAAMQQFAQLDLGRRLVDWGERGGQGEGVAIPVLGFVPFADHFEEPPTGASPRPGWDAEMRDGGAQVVEGGGIGVATTRRATGEVLVRDGAVG